MSLDAQDVTIRQILTEWARVGKTRIVNLERVTGGPVTLKFDGVPEKQALDIILRTIPATWRRRARRMVADASMYDRILIMPTTTAVAALRPQQPRALLPVFQNPSPNVTQLRQPPPCPLIPGMLPEPPNDPPIRWTIRRSRPPPLPASFPCPRSALDSRRPWFRRRILGKRRHRRRRLLALDAADQPVERADRNAAAESRAAGPV